MENPKITTERNINRFRKQLKSLGFSYDWDREINTTDPNYYKWTQWIFKKLFERGLAYQEEMPVWWCEELGTTLANEEVIDGKSEVGSFPCTRRPLRQWVLKITEYADKLLDGLGELDWPESTKEMQRNWIGRSEGAQIDFSIEESSEAIRVFTTRPDTLFGATYIVIAPEHPTVNSLTQDAKHKQVQKYCIQATRKSELERSELQKSKTGVFTGSYAINPANKKRIPIWIADYVLGNYGTGAVMAVPGEDQRDWEFAKAHGLPIIRTVAPPENFEGEAYTGQGLSINSDFLNGLSVEEAKKRIIIWLKEKNAGGPIINYKLRNWLFSRQRYWGEPMPIIHGKDGEIIPLNESDLPLTLPKVDKYEPTGTGESPLAGIDDWVNTGIGKRETNTMPQWAGSCWYYLRYTDPLNNDEAWNPEKEKYWMPVDLYVGGVEHAVLHLLYSRFWHHVLYDLGLVSTKEPFKKLFNQGMIGGEDGQKMSKSRGNVVNPDSVVDKYGADSFRLYEMFMGPLDKSKPWSTKGLQGCYRFTQKIWKLYTEDKNKIVEDFPSKETLRILHQTIKKVTVDLDNLSFNTAVSQMMIFVNHMLSQENYNKEVLHTFLIILNPFSPHIAEELNEAIFKEDYSPISEKPWPDFDDTLIVSDSMTIAVQINGKTRGTIEVEAGLDKEIIFNNIKENEKFIKYLKNRDIIKKIYVPNRLVNFVIV